MSSIKKPCEVCSRPVDPRGYKAHLMTHQENELSVRKPMTRISGEELEMFILGYERGKSKVA